MLCRLTWTVFRPCRVLPKRWHAQLFCNERPWPRRQYVIKAPATGVVEKVMYRVGDNVAKNALLVHMQQEEAGGSAADSPDTD